MSDDVRIAFDTRVRIIPLDQILPSKILAEGVLESTKSRRIAASVAQIGLVEPLVVSGSKTAGPYTLLDGHVRFHALREQGAESAKCLLADDDEAFTYNKRVNRLAVIQEHYMIVRALERGVSETKLAKALNVDVGVIRQRRQLLDGISPDVAELLKDKSVGTHAFKKLKKMKPLRQLEVAELMVSANNFSTNYAKALLATSKPADLHKPEQLKKATGLTTEQMARLEREMASVSQDYKELEASYGDDMLLLVIAGGFLERLLSRPALEEFLAERHSEMLETFRSIASAASLDLPAPVAA